MQGKGQFAPQQMLVSEIGSLSLEFTRLAQLTGDNKFYDAIARIGNVFEESQNKTKLPGMWPVVIDAGTPDFTRDSGFTLGGMSDSLYEYLPKQYMMLGGLLAQPRNLYEGFIEVAKKYMFFRPLNPENKDILVAGDVRSAGATTTPILDPKGQHLTCFTGGMLAIASKIFDRPQDLPIASKLTEGCVWAYDSQVTGIAPEIYSLVACTAANDDCKWEELRWHNALVFNDPSAADAVTYEEKVKNVIENGRLKPGFTAINDRRYILRPEAIESVFIMYRVTGDVAWQDKAWRMFQKIEAATRTGIASSAIDDVTKNKPSKLDSMESFWLAETLKYFYLIFSDTELVSLDKYVLNTEAHPLLRPA
jgi:mannosyl-oligosaccharide alpha-1,2-mannosidase